MSLHDLSRDALLSEVELVAYPEVPFTSAKTLQRHRSEPPRGYRPIPSRKIGRLVRYRVGDVLDWLVAVGLAEPRQ